MEKTVCFREFETRDIDFIYKCKNDEKLNSMIVGHFKPFSYEDAENWVHGCMGDHDSYKFWAIATNDDEKRIIGWASLSNIDRYNQSAHFHGIVIGDKNYNDGRAWIESYLFILNYVFDVLCINRLTGSHLVDHPMSGAIAAAMYFDIEGIFK
ncbi:MAG: GNAT family N-acetyltransferase, partial [Muribaculaceae bacterium]|nr:GNAT family N-acetyltransferase [Muribaculaceae bacterium]